MGDATRLDDRQTVQVVQMPCAAHFRLALVDVKANDKC